MKIRNGFVSNSSSSSFCIMGVVVENWDEANDLSKNNDLRIEFGIHDYYEKYIVGMLFHQLPMSRTINAMRKEILKMLNKNLPRGEKLNLENIQWHIDGGFDG